MKRLLLHIGMHKTGSSSIQETLGNSREILRKYNIWYPSMSEYNHTVNFTPIFSNDPLKDITFIMKEIINMEQAKKEQELLKKIWVKELNKINCEYTIISAEGCSMLLEPRVREMKEFLDEFFDDIKVLMYVREPSSFYVSSIQQWLKHMDNSFDDFSFKKPNQLYTRRLPGYINVFGRENIVIRPFSKNAFKNGDLIDDFFYSFGLKIDTKNIPRISTNESLGYNTTVLLSEYNKRYPGFINGRYNDNRGLARDIGKVIEIFNKVDNQKLYFDFHFSKEDADYINNEITYINQFLEDEYKFKEVEPSNTPNRFPTIKDIDSDYLIEVINEYNKEIERLQNESVKEVTKKTVKQLVKKKELTSSNFGIEYVSGWHEVEDNGVIWSSNVESTILLIAENVVSELVVSFNINHYLKEEILESLKISINNESAQLIKSDNKYLFIINKCLVGRGNKIEIMFKVNNVYSPKELGQGEDTRKLGFVLSNLSLVEM